MNILEYASKNVCVPIKRHFHSFGCLYKLLMFDLLDPKENRDYRVFSFIYGSFVVCLWSQKGNFDVSPNPHFSQFS